MVVEVEGQTSGALLSILVELTLVHVTETLGKGWALGLQLLLFLVVSHVLWEKIVVEIFLAPF
jgi:hypothetical protein